MSSSTSASAISVATPLGEVARGFPTRPTVEGDAYAIKRALPINPEYGRHAQIAVISRRC
jgi:hypothetical protein